MQYKKATRKGTVTHYQIYPCTFNMVRFHCVFWDLDRQLRGYLTVTHVLVLMVHICMKNTKDIYLLSSGVDAVGIEEYKYESSS